jgi:hypothetical protein
MDNPVYTEKANTQNVSEVNIKEFYDVFFGIATSFPEEEVILLMKWIGVTFLSKLIDPIASLSILHILCSLGKVKLATLLLEEGDANVKSPSKDGLLPIDFFLQRGLVRGSFANPHEHASILRPFISLLIKGVSLNDRVLPDLTPPPKKDSPLSASLPSPPPPSDPQSVTKTSTPKTSRIKESGIPIQKSNLPTQHSRSFSPHVTPALNNDTTNPEGKKIPNSNPDRSVISHSKGSKVKSKRSVTDTPTVLIHEVKPNSNVTPPPLVSQTTLSNSSSGELHRNQREVRFQILNL